MLRFTTFSLWVIIRVEIKFVLITIYHKSKYFTFLNSKFKKKLSLVNFSWHKSNVK